MAKFLDNTGLTHFWGKIKTLLAGKADSTHTHDEYFTNTQAQSLSDELNTALSGKANQTDLDATNQALARVDSTVGSENGGLVKDLNDLATLVANKADKSDISTVYKARGSLTSVPSPYAEDYNVGDVFNITNEFTTDATFIEGAGSTYPAGTNIVIVSQMMDVEGEQQEVRRWDVLAGFVDVSSLTPDAITNAEIDTMMTESTE